MRIILIEDNVDLAKGLAYRLEDRGHAVDWLSDGLAADEFLKSGGGDLIILDINLPRLDGLEVLSRMRARGDERPVLVLTARSDTDDRVHGLDIGADDYLVKPFEIAELEARIRALGRRLDRGLRPSLRLGPMRLDLNERVLYVDDAPVETPRREISVLEALMMAEGRVVSKADLLEHVYGTGADVEEQVVEVHISRLRKRLKPHGLAIQVRRGLGYSLSAAPEAGAP